MRKIVSMRDALADDSLLGGILDGDSWRPWRIVLIAIMGEALDDGELAIWTSLTGRTTSPASPLHEFWGICGRRAGKTRAMSTLCLYLGICVDWSADLVVGEDGRIVYLAQNQKQAQVALGYASGILSAKPSLASRIVSQNTESIRLRGGILIEVRPASFRSVRGLTAIACLADEIGFWYVEGTANPDSEILAAVRPSLATTGGPLIAISSPFARRGELFRAFEAHHGPDGDEHIAVAKAPSLTMNPTLPKELVERALQRDPAAARAEYLGEFRSDIEQFLSVEAVRSCIVPGLRELPYFPTIDYRAFVDPSGGVSDSMTLAIAHSEGERSILDLVREVKPPFDPEGIVGWMVDILKDYGLRSVSGDRYGGIWIRDAFERRGITYKPSELSRSEIYRNLLPRINSQTTQLLDNDRLVAQLIALERRTTRTGGEQVDHPPGGNDDLCNAAAGAISLITKWQDPAPKEMWEGMMLDEQGNAIRPDNPRGRYSSLFSGHQYLFENRKRWSN